MLICRHSHTASGNGSIEMAGCIDLMLLRDSAVVITSSCPSESRRIPSRERQSAQRREPREMERLWDGREIMERHVMER